MFIRVFSEEAYPETVQFLRDVRQYFPPLRSDQESRCRLPTKLSLAALLSAGPCADYLSVMSSHHASAEEKEVDFLCFLKPIGGASLLQRTNPFCELSAGYSSQCRRLTSYRGSSSAAALEEPLEILWGLWRLSRFPRMRTQEDKLAF